MNALAKQARNQIAQDSEAVDITFPLVKGLLNETTSLDDGLGSTGTSKPKIELMLYYKYAEVLEENKSVISINDKKYKVKRIFPNSATYISKVQLATEVEPVVAPPSNGNGNGNGK